MKRVETFSLDTDTDHDIIDHLEQLANGRKSGFIRDAVREKIGRETGDLTNRELLQVVLAELADIKQGAAITPPPQSTGEDPALALALAGLGEW